MQITPHFQTAAALRFVARDPDNPCAALLLWLGVAEPSRAASFFEATQRFSPLMQVVLPDEQPGVFVNPFAIRTVLPAGSIKRLIFLDDSWLEIRYSGNCDDLCNLHPTWTHMPLARFHPVTPMKPKIANLPAQPGLNMLQLIMSAGPRCEYEPQTRSSVRYFSSEDGAG